MIVTPSPLSADFPYFWQQQQQQGQPAFCMMKERIDTERRPAGEEEEGGLCSLFSFRHNIPVAKEHTKIIDEADSGISLTDADCGEEADAGVGRVALREEGLRGVDGEGQGHDGLGARPHYDALRPQPEKSATLINIIRFNMIVCSLPDKGHKVTKSDHDVSIVGARLLYHAAQLCIAVGTDHGEDAGEDPYRKGHIDAAHLQQHSRRGDKDAGPNDGAHDDCQR